MKQDSQKAAIKKRDREISAKLKKLVPKVLNSTKIETVHSLNGLIGHKNEHFIDVRNEIIYSQEQYTTKWLEGLLLSIREMPSNWRTDDNSKYRIYSLIKDNSYFRDYLYLFLERTFLRNIDSYSKAKPKIEDSEIWIGQENASYGILVSPRFVDGQWENDKSEIRHFNKDYWSIGHIMKTGLVVPYKNKKFDFKTIDEYLDFFKYVIVRSSGSKYELEIAEKYAEFVLSHKTPEKIPLLIPEYRYRGISRKHEYRLDFTIIQDQSFEKIGFELSPWSSHGYLSKIKEKTQTQVNFEAQKNFEKEIEKLRKYFKKFHIYTLIYSDNSLNSKYDVFNDIREYLEPKSFDKQLKLHIYEDILKSDF